MRPGSRPQDPCRPNGKRRPPLVRAPPARSRVFGRTLLTALRPRFTVHWRRRNQRAEASPEPRLRVPSAGRPRSARPRRPVSPSRPSTERPSAPASRGRPPARWRSSVAAPPPDPRRLPPETRFLEPSRVSAAPGGHERNSCATGPGPSPLITSFRLGYSARREGRPSQRAPPGRLAQREKEHPRRPRTTVLRRTRGAGVASSPRAAAVEATLRGAARAACFRSGTGGLPG